jgi:Sec-independent protein translocase protein TatA
MVANIFGPDLGIVVVIILVVLVAGSQLPKIARNVGTAGREFRKAQREAEEEAEREKVAQAPLPPQAVGPAPIPAPPPVVTAPAPIPAQPPVATAPAPIPAPPPVAAAPADESVTLSKSELEALLKAREEQGRREATGQAGTSGS